MSGVSLAETIIACFILTGAMLVSGALFHTALNYSVKIDKKYVASRVAERRLEEIKSWSRQVHGTNGDLEFAAGWEAYHNSVFDDPQNPGFRVETTVEDKVLFSPSSAFEQVFFASQEEQTSTTVEKRWLEGSAKIVSSTAIWGLGASDRLTLTCLIADPGKDFGWDEENLDNAIQITLLNGASPPGTLAMNQEITLKAEVQDAGGAAIRRPAIQWYIDPDSTGNGTLTTRPRYPDRVTFQNVIRVNTDPGNPGAFVNTYPGGQVRIVARARLGGVDAVKATFPITLEN